MAEEIFEIDHRDDGSTYGCRVGYLISGPWPSGMVKVDYTAYDTEEQRLQMGEANIPIGSLAFAILQLEKGNRARIMFGKTILGRLEELNSETQLVKMRLHAGNHSFPANINLEELKRVCGLIP